MAMPSSGFLVTSGHDERRAVVGFQRGLGDAVAAVLEGTAAQGPGVVAHVQVETVKRVIAGVT